MTNPGTADTMGRVVVAGGSNVYVGHLPAETEAPAPFADVAARLHRERGCLVLGVREPEGGRECINPPRDFQVQPEHLVIYLAAEPVLEPAREPR